MPTKYLIILIALYACLVTRGQSSSPHDLHFSDLPKTWDDGIPLGNGMLGVLIWQKDSCLRISLDRADLWDLRLVKEFKQPQFSIDWVKEQVEKGNYDTVQKLFDLPYDRDPAPTKIPAGALEIPINGLGPILSAHLFLTNALCEIKWKSGVRLRIFVDATKTTGWFRFENFPGKFALKLDPPPYNTMNTEAKGDVVEGQDPRRLGYPAGSMEIRQTSIYFLQPGWNNFSYEISVMWNQKDISTIEGTWSITTKNTPYSPDKSSWTYSHDALENGFDKSLEDHIDWWKRYWSRSEIHLPDSVLENQWYREIYKFGSTSRPGVPPITLQAVWTADNGKLPPWKGDFHHDLNTELSYWPSYSSNHTEEGSAFTDWIWLNRQSAEAYTKTYYNKEGLNFPGVSTLTGQPMGGWIQYAFSPTISAWLAHHFYLQWKYTLDTAFLRDRAYPFLFDVAAFITDFSVKDGKQRRLPLSSSPEFFDNSLKAWFRNTTNYDLALIRWLYGATIEMAVILGKENDVRYLKKLLNEWPYLSLSESNTLLIAPGISYQASHRHFSHLMAIYPLGILDWNRSKKEQNIIRSSLNELISRGPDYWCGYSWAWLGSLEARARNGKAAAEALRTFATCFCLPNSFHVNGDQSGTGKSKFTYHPFTLEGNFAYAAGVQEMLLQSNNDIIRVFPAIPEEWNNVSFRNLRAEGAFLVSAVKSEGKMKEVRIFPEKGGKLIIENPFKRKNRIRITGGSKVKINRQNLIEMKTKPGEEIILTPIPSKR